MSHATPLKILNETMRNPNPIIDISSASGSVVTSQLVIVTATSTPINNSPHRICTDGVSVKWFRETESDVSVRLVEVQ